MRQSPADAARPTVRADDQTIIQEFLAFLQELKQEQFQRASVDVAPRSWEWIEEGILQAMSSGADQWNIISFALKVLPPDARDRINPSLRCLIEAEIDFGQLTWEQFEKLCVDLLEAEGFMNVMASGGAGGDQGRDISAEELITSRTGKQWILQWMVQCKHYAASGRSVGHREVADIIDFLSTHDADGLLVITDTNLTASLVKKLEKFDRDKKHPYKAVFWNGHRLRKLLLERHLNLLARYFSKPAYHWSAYS